jgi:hypothetical protein
MTHTDAWDAAVVDSPIGETSSAGRPEHPSLGTLHVRYKFLHVSVYLVSKMVVQKQFRRIINKEVV